MAAEEDIRLDKPCCLFLLYQFNSESAKLFRESVGEQKSKEGVAKEGKLLWLFVVVREGDSLYLWSSAAQ
jgi:hypothetical protein